MAQDKFDVGGMTCAACQAHVDRAVSKLDGVQSVAVNLLAGSMLVDYDPAQGLPRRHLHRCRPRGLLGLTHQHGHRRCPKRKCASQVRRRPYGVTDQKVGGRRLCHAHPPHRLDRIPHPTVLHRHGAHARLAAARHLHRPHPQHDARAHRACPAHSHRLRQRRVLYQRV